MDEIISLLRSINESIREVDMGIGELNEDIKSANSGATGESSSSSGMSISGTFEMIGSIVSAVKSAVISTFDFIMSAVGAFRPYQLVIFQRAVDDLMAVIGEDLFPIFTEVVDWIREIGTYLNSLPEDFKDIIRFIADAIMHLGLLGLLLDKLAGNSSEFNGFLKDLLSTFEGIVQGAIDIGRGIKAYLQPALDELMGAFNEMSGQLQETLNDLKPLIATIMVSVGKEMAIAFELFIKGLKLVVNYVTWTAKQISRILKELGIEGIKLPKTDRETKSNLFKAASSDAGLTTSTEVFKTIQNNILRSTGANTDPSKEINKKMDPIQKTLEDQLKEQRQTNTTQMQMIKVLSMLVGGEAGRAVAGLVMGN